MLNLFQQFAATEQVSTPIPGLDETVQSIISDARINFETVFRIYYLRHGFAFHDSVLFFHIVMLCFLLSASYKLLWTKTEQRRFGQLFFWS